MLLSDKPDMCHPRGWDPVFPPAMHCGSGTVGEARHGACTAQRVNDGVGFGFHETEFATIANKTQAIVCDNRFCEKRETRLQRGMIGTPLDNARLRELMAERNTTNRSLAQELNIDEDKVSKSLKGIRRWKAEECIKLLDWMGETVHPASGQSVALPVLLPSEAALTEMFAALL